MFTIWYNDDFGLSKITVFKQTREEAISYFKQYYKKYEFEGIESNENK